MSTTTNANESAYRRNIIFVVIFLVIAVIAGTFAIIATNGDSDSTAPSGSQSQSGTSTGTVPSAGDVILADSDGVSVVGSDFAPVKGTIKVTFDYMCEYCYMFESTYGEDINTSVANGDAVYIARPVSILSGATPGTSAFNTSNSTKMAIIAYYIAENDPDHFLAFSSAAFTQFETLYSKYSDDAVVNVMTSVGIDPAVAADAIDATSDGAWQKFISTETRALAASDFKGTPEILVNGTELPESVNWLNDESGFVTYLTENGVDIAK